MNAPSVDIKDMLEAESPLGLVYATNLFVGREPSEPNECVTIFDTAGWAPELTLEGDGGYTRPSIQIRVRGEKYTTGWALIYNIHNLLHGRNHETWNGAEYQVIKCTSGPALLDWDERGRPRFIINFDCQRR